MTPSKETEDERRDGFADRPTRGRTAQNFDGGTTDGWGSIACDRVDRLLLGFIAKKLEDEPQAQVSEHLRYCRRCRESLHAVQYVLETKNDPE